MIVNVSRNWNYIIGDYVYIITNCIKNDLEMSGLY